MFLILKRQNKVQASEESTQMIEEICNLQGIWFWFLVIHKNVDEVVLDRFLIKPSRHGFSWPTECPWA